MINESKKSDFFPISREQLSKLTYQDTEEDLLHEKYFRELEAEIYENSDADLENNSGELPFDEEADRKRWDELEKDFDRIFEDSAHRAD